MLAGVVTVIFAVALISDFISSPFATAQEEKSKQETAQEEKLRGEHELETMTVTAQKQEENVQEVPMSITVFDEQDIEDKKIESVLEIADFVPNLMIYLHGVSGMNAPTMRGITAAHESFSVSTGLYVDGVPILTGPGFVNEMLDIERIEVLRGPQGTIYGKGTEAGLLISSPGSRTTSSEEEHPPKGASCYPAKQLIGKKESFH